MSKPKNDTANARPKRKKTALIIAIVLLLACSFSATGLSRMPTRSSKPM